MVVLHVKTADDKNQFLYRTTITEKVGDVINKVTTLHLLRIKILQLADAVQALAKHGPLRKPEARGLSDEVAKLSGFDDDIHSASNPDEHLQRTGNPPSEQVATMMIGVCEKVAGKYTVSPMTTGMEVTETELAESLNELKGAIMIAYPDNHGLPPYDTTRSLLEDISIVDMNQEISHDINHENACLWWVGKQLQANESLSFYMGENEKQRTIVRLQPKKAGPPVREPRIDPETHKALLAYCHKSRQKENELENDDDLIYLNSPWADSKALKNSLLNGGRQITWRY